MKDLKENVTKKIDLVKEKWTKRRDSKKSELPKLLKIKLKKLEEYDPESKGYQVISNEIYRIIELQQSETEVKDKTKTNKKKILIELLGIGVSACITIKFMKDGFKFEEDGTYTSNTFRTFISQKIFKKLG